MSENDEVLFNILFVIFGVIPISLVAYFAYKRGMKENEKWLKNILENFPQGEVKDDVVTVKEDHNIFNLEKIAIRKGQKHSTPKNYLVITVKVNCPIPAKITRQDDALNKVGFIAGIEQKLNSGHILLDQKLHFHTLVANWPREFCADSQVVQPLLDIFDKGVESLMFEEEGIKAHYELKKEEILNSSNIVHYLMPLMGLLSERVIKYQPIKPLGQEGESKESHKLFNDKRRLLTFPFTFFALSVLSVLPLIGLLTYEPLQNIDLDKNLEFRAGIVANILVLLPYGYWLKKEARKYQRPTDIFIACMICMGFGVMILSAALIRPLLNKLHF